MSCSGVDALPLHGIESFGPDLPLPLLEDLLADPLLQAHAQSAPSATLSGGSSRSSATCGRPACGAGACGCAPVQGGAPRSAADLLECFARQLAEREDGFELGAASSAARSPPGAGVGSPEAVTVLQQQPTRAEPAALHVHVQLAGAVQAQQAVAAGASGVDGSASAPASRGGSMSPQASAAALPCSSGDSSAAAAARANPGPNTAGAKRQRSGEECSSSAAAAGSSAAARGAPAAAPSAQLVAPAAACGGPGPHAAYAPGGQASSGEESEEQKRQARMARNRESALHSRQRKKMQADELERRCDALAADNRRLAGTTARGAKPSPECFGNVVAAALLGA